MRSRPTPALATEPRLLALDEPAAGMNATETAELKRLLERIRADGMTLLLIEHDVRLVMGLCDRVAVLGVVPECSGVWGEAGHTVRAVMDFLRFLHPSFADARALRARMKRKVLPSAYRWLDAIPRLGGSTVRRFERVLMTAERAIPVCEPIRDFLRQQAPDVLLVSPLVVAASEQVDWIKAARACGIRTAVCVASWDNLTNKGLLRIEPDMVVVWNEAQRREARDYHYVDEQKVAVTGAQLFDRWFEKTVTRDRAAFCEREELRRPLSGPAPRCG